MPVDMAQSAMQSVADHLGTLQTLFKGQQVALVARVGWPEKDIALDMRDGPVVTITHIATERKKHNPCQVSPPGPPPVQWKIADVVITAQVDLWAGHRGVRDDAARVIDAGWHNRMPQQPGLFLDHTDYFNSPLTAELSDGQNVDDAQDGSVGEFRRTWSVSIESSEIVETQTPQQLTHTIQMTIEPSASGQGDIVGYGINVWDIASLRAGPVDGAGATSPPLPPGPPTDDGFEMTSWVTLTDDHVGALTFDGLSTVTPGGTYRYGLLGHSFEDVPLDTAGDSPGEGGILPVTLPWVVEPGDIVLVQVRPTIDQDTQGVVVGFGKRIVEGFTQALWCGLSSSSTQHQARAGLDRVISNEAVMPAVDYAGFDYVAAQFAGGGRLGTMSVRSIEDPPLATPVGYNRSATDSINGLPEWFIFYAIETAAPGQTVNVHFEVDVARVRPLEFVSA